MPGTSWSQSEKRIARRVIEAALARELSEVLAEFKARAARAVDAEEMWALRDYLNHAQREIDGKYDYRYLQLEVVFGRLVRERRIEEHDLAGLAEDKLNTIRRVASL